MPTNPEHSHIDSSAPMEFYRDVLATLSRAKVPYLLGGGYALYAVTGVARMTKDLDLFLKKSDLPEALKALTDAGFQAEVAYSHWLAKARRSDDFVDLIFSSGNGRCPVDDVWFQQAIDGTVGGQPVKLAPPEEMIWQKAFIMERERFDGADIAHLLHVRARTLNWERLLNRFGDDWRVLLAHLVMFGFIYPGEQSLIPVGVMHELTDRLRRELESPHPPDTACAGTLLSREQFNVDINEWNYADARLWPRGEMTPLQLAEWTPPHALPAASGDGSRSVHPETPQSPAS